MTPALRVRIEGGFWKFYRELLRETVIPYQWRAMNDEIPGAPRSHSVENFRIAAGRSSGAHEGMVFQDSDLAKWLEAAGYLLGEEAPGNQQLREWVNEAVDLIAGAQQPDGYLNTYFTLKDPGGRWTNLREAHEMYSAGHLIEAGVALYGSTADRRILDVVRRLADHLDARFGLGDGKVRGYCGHEEVELALVKLARATGEPRYLRLAAYFVDERGQSPSYFRAEASAAGYRRIFGIDPLEYYQAHQPVREQADVVGHAVRAMYLYAAMADLALENHDSSLVGACDRLWQRVTSRKMYVTGGIGSSAHLESFGPDFDLPNDTAYAETCAAIGLFLFSSRMARLHGEAKYADVMERALYNGILGGLSLDGQSYFYVNPLEVVPAVCEANGSYRHVKYRRQGWYGCACCPPNIARTIASLGEYAYRLDRDTLFADLYHEGSARVRFLTGEIELRQRTGYPWDGAVAFDVAGGEPAEFTLALRIPFWCRSHSLTVNGEASTLPVAADGYLHIRRRWKKGDAARLVLAMEPERVYADPRVRADCGKVAVQRGPIVYCIEEADNGAGLHQVHLPRGAALKAVRRPELLGGVSVIEAEGLREALPADSGTLYSTARPAAPLLPTNLRFVPYFSWANRSPGEMAVWVRE